MWQLIPETVELTSDEVSYYITAPGLTAAIPKAQVRASLPETNLLDTMRLTGEYRWISMENGRLCVSHSCMVDDLWTSCGTVRAELAVVDGALTARSFSYIAPDGLPQ